MREHLPVLLFLIPFMTAVSMPLIGLFRWQWCRPISLLALSIMSLTSLVAFGEVVRRGEIRYPFSGWAPPVGIEWLLDGLSGVMMIPVSLIALIALIYAGPGVQMSLSRREIPFHALVLLLVSALTGLVLSADLFNIFVFLEVASLCGYALVAVAGGRALVAAFRYLILGTIGASFYLLAIGYLYASSGTLNMADLGRQLPDLLGSTAVLSGLVFLIIGLGIKVALVPLHGWLPDAYAHAPESVSPLIASLMTKVSLYALVRITFWMVGAGAIWEEVPIMIALGWLGAIATLTGAFLALSEQNIKRMFAYGGLSHIGLIVLGLSLGNATGFTGGIFYLLNDAVMQASLFFVAGTLAYRFGVREIADLSRLAGRIPWTVGALIVTALSMVGIPPTGGFFGKWFILLGALEAGNYPAVAVILVGTVLTLAYFVRIIEKLLLETRKSARLSGVEAPWEMRLGMGLTSVIIILMGIFSDPAISLIRRLALPPGF